MKLRPYIAHGDADRKVLGYHHWCPACNGPHGIATGQPNSSGAIWSFNGNLERPTFTPSVRFFTTESGVEHTLCHYFITDGSIVFCGDNPHALNGQTVPLPEYPERHE